MYSETKSLGTVIAQRVNASGMANEKRWPPLLLNGALCLGDPIDGLSRWSGTILTRKSKQGVMKLMSGNASFFCESVIYSFFKSPLIICH